MLSVQDFSKKQILFLFSNKGEKLAYKNDNIIVLDENKKIKHQSTCYRLFAIFVFGNTTITTGLIQRARKFGFSIVLFSTSFRVYQVISSVGEANSLLKQKQFTEFNNNLVFAQKLIENKIVNQRSLLNNQRYKSDYCKTAINKLNEYKSKLSSTKNIHEIMGYEGLASKLYFQSHFNNILWQGRKPRIKNDMVNCLLDIGYTILFNYIEALLTIFGFDCYKGFLHTQFYMRKSLVCDIVEPFRPLIDNQVKKGMNLNQFKEKDFEIINNKWCLKWKESPKYISILIQPILQNKEEIFLYIRSFYRTVMKNTLEQSFPMFLMGKENDYSKL